MRMRVCMLTTSYPRGRTDYAGIFVRSLARILVEQDIAVDVIAPHSCQAARYESAGDLRVHRFVYMWPLAWQKLAYGDGIPMNVRERPWTLLLLPLFLLFLFVKAWRICAECDILHVHWVPLGWIGLVLRRHHRLPLVVHARGSDVRQLPAWSVRPVLERADQVIASSLEVGALLEGLGIPKDRYEVVHSPLSEELECDIGDHTAVLAEIGVDVGSDIVTFVGRLNDFKDPLTLVRAAPLVLDRHSAARFVIVGDGPLCEPAKQLVHTIGVEHAVRFTGARPDVGRVLSVSKVFTALSPVENVWSTAIAEAMHMGVPCVITRAGHTEELFTHLENAYLVAPKDPAAVADAVHRLLTDYRQRENVVEGAHRLMEYHHRDRAAIARQIVALYAGVLSRAPRWEER